MAYHRRLRYLAGLTAFSFSLLHFAAPSFAQNSDSSSTLKSQDLIEIEHPNSGNEADDIDLILTNKKMRAESGSKSKWSVSTSFNYSGGTMSDPLAEDRPNIAGSTGQTDKALLGGTVSGKYVISASQALLAGVGVRWLTPVQGTQKPSNYSGKKVDADNPTSNYQYIYRMGAVQAVAQATATFITQSNMVADGYVATLGLSQNNAYDIPGTELAVGIYVYTAMGFFNKNDLISKTKQGDYSFGFEPFVEYNITDRLNLRSGWNLWIFEHIRSESNPNIYRWDKVTQNVGLGISISRDFFLYPNIQFLPDNIRSDKTTVAISSNINIF